MAARVPLDREGLVVELGGGTGAVTTPLLKHGVPPWKLVVVERSPTLANPSAPALSATANHPGRCRPTEHLFERPSPPINSIVSSLPLRSLHPTVTRAISHQFETCSNPAAC
jgi:phosphatidylethanolamine/phosphatidyl-N-methylethanolamine N-methyltransferase